MRKKDVPPPSRRFRPLRAVALGAGGIVLAWLVISGSLVAYLANGAPEAALWLSPSDPEALLTLAERRFDPARIIDPKGPSVAPAASGASSAVRAAPHQVRLRVETALAGDPLNARALRILGQVAHTEGDEGHAAKFMRAAARRRIHESAAVHWLMQNSYERKDYRAALRFADALLRTRSQVMPHVLPILGAMAENPEARDELHRLLAGNPPWRRAFFSALPRAVSDARTPLVFLLAERKHPNPPTLADIGNYVNLLVAHKFYELAYYTWLQFLPSEQLSGAGFLFNGSFELAPSGLPFDWTLSDGTGATVEIAQRPDRPGQHALFIALGPGRVELRGAAQTLLLAPGTYRFEGRYRGKIDGPRGLVWRVACAGTPGAPIGQSPMLIGSAAPWRDVAFSFTVPEANCRAQHLRLVLDARMESERLVSGSVWFDELHLARDK